MRTSIDLPQSSLDGDVDGKNVDIADEVEIKLPVVIRRKGHLPVFENGSMVVVNTYAMLYGQLEEPYVGPRVNTMKDGNHSGIVVDRTWHYNKKQANRCLSSGNTYVISRGGGEPPLLTGVSVELWYHVMFHEGLFWVRYDWIDLDVSRHVDK